MNRGALRGTVLSRGFSRSFLIASSLWLSSSGQAADDLTLTRLDCGGTQGRAVDVALFSDTYAYQDEKLPLTASCYLIHHGEDYMLWDTGYPAPPNQFRGLAVSVTVVDQLAELDLTPDRIRRVAISHYHGDHLGQAMAFPDATLLIGQKDWDALTASSPAPGVDPTPLRHWISGGGRVELIARDHDVFGDGRVVILDLPGHTPGHKGLLVRLADMGDVLLTGDLAHFRENYESEGVPTFNTDRADTLASFDRFKALARNLGAIVVIQHDPRDIGILPAFPTAAR